MGSWIGDVLAVQGRAKVDEDFGYSRVTEVTSVPEDTEPGVRNVPSLSGKGISSNKFREAAELIVANGGGTFDRYGEVVTLDVGYIVGGVVPTFKRELVPGALNASAYTLAWFAARHWAELDKPNRYLGAWVDEGKLYLDVSEVVDGSLRRAIGLALYRGEFSVWDTVSQTAIDTDEALRLLADS